MKNEREIATPGEHLAIVTGGGYWHEMLASDCINWQRISANRYKIEYYNTRKGDKVDFFVRGGRHPRRPCLEVVLAARHVRGVPEKWPIMRKSLVVMKYQNP